MAFITSCDLNAFLSRALNQNWPPLISSLMKLLSVDWTEISGLICTRGSHRTVSTSTHQTFSMQLPLGWENVQKAQKWVWVVNWIRVGCGICQNGGYTAVTVWTATIGSLCNSQCCTIWPRLHTKCLQLTFSLTAVWDQPDQKNMNYWTVRWTHI